MIRATASRAWVAVGRVAGGAGTGRLKGVVRWVQGRLPVRGFSTEAQVPPPPQREAPEPIDIVSTSVLPESTLVFSELSKSCCVGCGVKLQMTDPYEEGYIDYKVFAAHLARKIAENSPHKNDDVHREIERYLTQQRRSSSDTPPEKKAESIDPPPREEWADLEDDFFRSFWKRKETKVLNCLRCQKIKNHEWEEVAKIRTRLKGYPVSRLVGSLMRHIHADFLTLVVTDLHDLESLVNSELLQALITRKADIHIVVNKMDTFPSEGAHMEQFKDALFRHLSTLRPAIPNFVRSSDQTQTALRLSQVGTGRPTAGQ